MMASHTWAWLATRLLLPCRSSSNAASPMLMRHISSTSSCHFKQAAGGNNSSPDGRPESQSKLKTAWRIATAQEPASAATGAQSRSSNSSVIELGDTQGTLTRLSRALNLLTGYDSVEHLKHDVEACDERLRSLRKQLQAAKNAYEERLEHQRALSKEMSLLLQRKSNWSPADVARFTDVYASEHANEAAVAAAKDSYEEAGEAVETAQAVLMQKIRERYTQEQLWSDKIRRAATWWTWGLMGLQAVSFVAVYAVMEPRRRALLQSAVGTLVVSQGNELQGQLQDLKGEIRRLSGSNSSSSEDSSSSQDSSTGAVAEPRGRSAGSSSDSGQQQQQQWLSQVLEDLQQVKQQLATVGAVVSAGAHASSSLQGPAPLPQQPTKQQVQHVDHHNQQKQQQQRVQRKPRQPARPPRNAAERLLQQAASGLRNLWSQGATVVLRRCPSEVTLSREEVAGLAVLSAAAGSVLTVLAVVALSAASGGKGGGSTASLGGGG